MTREDLLDAKAAELQEVLVAWAREHGILGAGEELVFTLRVRPVVTVRRDESDTTLDSPEALPVSNIKSHYTGTFVRPAQLGNDDMRLLLAELTPQARSEMRRLLVDYKNNPTRIYSAARQQFNKRLQRKTLDGKFYRVVSVDKKSQLWEVRPPQSERS